MEYLWTSLKMYIGRYNVLNFNEFVLTGTFSSLHIEDLKDVGEVDKPDFIINPHKYFGEKTEEKTPPPPQLPGLSQSNTLHSNHFN